MPSPIDPFAVPMIFLRIGWMDRYEGLSGGDAIAGGGAYILEHGFGHEIFNFRPFQGRVYGYVQPPGAAHNASGYGGINLGRLGADSGAFLLDGVLAVWVATSPQGGAYIVGWYRNARVFRDWQPPPEGSTRRHADVDCGYYVSASADDAVLVAPDNRVFEVPSRGPAAFGQSNVWYADDERNHQFRQDVIQYIETGSWIARPIVVGRQPDPLLRQRVEKVAIETTTKHFEGLGYRVDSFEADNCGWDLEATLQRRLLRLEVKGLSGLALAVELTPNEYAQMQAHQDSYRLCVVTEALTEPKLHVFAYSPDSGRWETAERLVLAVQPIIAARCSAS